MAADPEMYRNELDERTETAAAPIGRKMTKEEYEKAFDAQFPEDAPKSAAPSPDTEHGMSTPELAEKWAGPVTRRPLPDDALREKMHRAASSCDGHVTNGSLAAIMAILERAMREAESRSDASVI